MAHETPDPSPPGGPWARLLPVAVIALAMVAVFATGLHRELTVENLLARRDALQDLLSRNYAAVLLGFMGVYVAAVALSIPGALILTLSGGFLFGWWVGGLAAVVSATLGAVLLFLAARTSLGDLLRRKAGPRLQAFAHGFEADAFSYILLLRLIPIPFWLVNLAPALFGVPLRTFAAATFLGIIPGTFAFAATGAGLDSVIAGKREAQRACQAAGGDDCALRFGLGDVLTPQLLAALAALALVAMIPVAVRRFSGRRLPDAGGPA